MELKPCPFCGNYAEILRKGTTRQSMIVACAWCGCRLESNETGEPKQWNTRATDAEQERLRAALQSILRHLSTARDCIDISNRFYQSQAAFSAVQEARAALNGEGEG